MVKLSRWGRAAAEPEAPERGRFGDHSFFTPKEKSSSLHAAEAQEALLLLRTFEASQKGWFWAVDREGCLTYISECVARSLTDAPAELLGTQFSDVFGQADGDLTGRGTLPFVLARQSPFNRLTLCPADVSDQRYWAVSGTPQFDAAGRFTGYRGSALTSPNSANRRLMPRNSPNMTR
jgi:hypothetical protein